MYNIEYLENMLRMYSKSAENICRIRWNFVAECNAKTVLDYGCGCGWFRAFRPEGITVDSFDIIREAPQTGINHKQYDLITLFDVLEHLDGFNQIQGLLDITKYVALTVPIKPEGVELKRWKHWKPGEHLHVFTMDTIETLFNNYGFELLKSGTSECPPRQDIVSFLFIKRAANG